MTTANTTLDLIGNTPLVRLNGPSEATGCDIFGKCEYANPGASRFLHSQGAHRAVPSQAKGTGHRAVTIAQSGAPASHRSRHTLQYNAGLTLMSSCF